MSRVRSGLLAAWATAWLSGAVPYDRVVDVVTGDDEPHRVVGLPEGPAGPGGGRPVPLGWLLSALRDRGTGAVRLVLPVPGDPRGLPGPGAFTDAALAAGEGVLADGLGAVPTVTRHGSAVGSATTSTLWTVYEVGAPSPDPLSVPEAEYDLAAALREAAAALSELDTASWRPGLAEAAERAREAVWPQLPPRHDQRAVRLLAQADRLAAVLALADGDAPGGAVTGWQARARDEALRPLRTSVRRARLAAYNAVPAHRGR
jgi:hypothetical protein